MIVCKLQGRKHCIRAYPDHPAKPDSDCCCQRSRLSGNSAQ